MGNIFTWRKNKWLNRTIGILLALGIAYYIVIWQRSASQIKTLCHSLVTNQTEQAVIAKIKQNSLLQFNHFEKDETTTIHVHSTANFGRHACFIKLKNKHVVSTSYSFLD